MINLKDYDVRNGIAYPKRKVAEPKPKVRTKVIDTEDLKATPEAEV